MHTRIQTLIQNHPDLEGCVPQIEEAFAMLRDSYAAGGTLLLCGNGGSASDADHISGELLKGFQSKRPLTPEQRAAVGDDLADRLQQGLPALPLPNFTSLATAYMNDVDPQMIFAQLVMALGRPGDVLLAISTSGNAENVGNALRVARGRGLKTLGLTGETGGSMLPLCDLAIRVPSTETFRIQEYHLPVYHGLCLMLEDHFFGETA
jgi:D-sedoheptulose 7-phosphate isomerase